MPFVNAYKHLIVSHLFRRNKSLEFARERRRLQRCARGDSWCLRNEIRYVDPSADRLRRHLLW